MMENAHTLTIKEIMDFFGTDPNLGLHPTQVLELREEFERNELPPEEQKSVWDLIQEQLNDLLVKILIVAAVVSYTLAFIADEDEYAQQGWTIFAEPTIILLMVVIQTGVGVWQQRHAESAIQALKGYEPDTAKVLRADNPGVQKIPAIDLVPGDIVEISVGDKIPADVRLIEVLSSSFRVDQCVLTGESASVSKYPDVIPDPAAVTQDKHNILFSGTNVTNGKATGIVVATGLHTAIGKIRVEMEATEKPPTPLQRKLDELSYQLTVAVSFLGLVAFLLNFFTFSDPSGSFLRTAVHNLKGAVSLAVAAIPGGLKGVMTVCLALSTRRMATKHAIVRNLPCVESLGYTTVICSDKTGTLTTNQMCVRRVFILGERENGHDFEISGSTYRPCGRFYLDGRPVIPDSFPVLEEVALISVLANDSAIAYNTQKRHFERIGEATEAALIVLAEKINPYKLTKSGLDLYEAGRVTRRTIEFNWDKLFTLEFSRDRRSMSSFCVPRRQTRRNIGISEPGENHPKLFCKGAPDSVLPRCSYCRVGQDTVEMTPEILEEINLTIEEYSTGMNMLRCLALATRDDPPAMALNNTEAFVQYESQLTFVAIVGLVDPPRMQVASAIEKCKEAGIRVVVLTGDNKTTAEAICRRIGVFGEDEDTTKLSYTGREFDDMSPSQQRKACSRAKLFSRVEPSHKSKIVERLNSLEEVTAMTGDGVNDAPALKKAEIGIAMGSGTGVAKAASDMVLADDNFGTIVSAIEEGRAIYSNMKQFIRFLLSCNIGEVTSIFLILILRLPEALVPVHLLWVNLVTDGFPATALGFNPPELDVMSQPPRKASESLVSTWIFIRCMAVGLYVGASTIMAEVWWFILYEDGPRVTFEQLTHYTECEDNAPGFENIDCVIFINTRPMTMAMSVLVTSEMLHSLNNMSENQSILVMPPFYNRWLPGAIWIAVLLHFALLYIPAVALVFQVTPLNPKEWTIVLKLAIPVILIDETLKYIARSTFSHIETILIIWSWIILFFVIAIELI